MYYLTALNSSNLATAMFCITNIVVIHEETCVTLVLRTFLALGKNDELNV